jgi:hypothetical protein
MKKIHKVFQKLIKEILPLKSMESLKTFFKNGGKNTRAC